MYCRHKVLTKANCMPDTDTSRPAHLAWFVLLACVGPDPRSAAGICGSMITGLLSETEMGPMRKKSGDTAPTPAKPAAKRGSGIVDQKIYDSVLKAVMSQRLPPGTKLTEASLCELFAVSRTIVRKAIQRLAHDHILEL